MPQAADIIVLYAESFTSLKELLHLGYRGLLISTAVDQLLEVALNALFSVGLGKQLQ
jgi:hypothetical protein